MNASEHKIKILKMDAEFEEAWIKMKHKIRSKNFISCFDVVAVENKEGQSITKKGTKNSRKKK